MSKIILLLVALVTCCGVIAQSTITGTVVDDKNAPVPYASISIKNSKKGVTADANGNFSISANTGETLVVSAVSFTSQEIQVTSTSPITVHLASGSQTLNEVVVTALGVKREKRSLAYAAQTVGGDELNKSGIGNPLAEFHGVLTGVPTYTGDKSPLMDQSPAS